MSVFAVITLVRHAGGELGHSRHEYCYLSSVWGLIRAPMSPWCDKLAQKTPLKEMTPSSYSHLVVVLKITYIGKRAVSSHSGLKLGS